MKTTDLATWTGVLKYQDIQAPVACAAGTVQDDQCVERYMDMQSPWCCLVPQLGITSTAIDCTGRSRASAMPATVRPMRRHDRESAGKGCCDDRMRDSSRVARLARRSVSCYADGGGRKEC